MGQRLRLCMVNVPVVLRGRLKEILANHHTIDVTPTDRAQDCPAADVVLAVSANPGETATARHLLCTSGAQRVALMTTSGREMVVYELTQVPMLVADLSTSGMVDLLCKGLVPG